MPQTSVVMVTMHENPDYLFEAVKAEAAGCSVLKDAPGESLVGAVEEDAQREIAVEPGAGDEASGEAGKGEGGRWGRGVVVHGR